MSGRGPANLNLHLRYMVLNVVAEQVQAAIDIRSAHARRLSSYRSVLGWCGSEDLGDGFKAIWQIEGALALDTDVGGLASRDTRVGLTGRAKTGHPAAALASSAASRTPSDQHKRWELRRQWISTKWCEGAAASAGT